MTSVRTAVAMTLSITLAVAAVGLLLDGWALWAGDSAHPATLQGGNPTETPPESSAIPSPAEAISRTIEFLPPEAGPHMAEARLIGKYDFAVWSYDTPSGVQTPALADFPGEIDDPDAPVWLVAVLLEGLTARDVLQLGFDGYDSVDTRPVVGAYFAWDANAGELIELGGLRDMDDYYSIETMVGRALSVEAATDVASSVELQSAVSDGEVDDNGGMSGSAVPPLQTTRRVGAVASLSSPDTLSGVVAEATQLRVPTPEGEGWWMPAPFEARWSVPEKRSVTSTFVTSLHVTVPHDSPGFVPDRLTAPISVTLFVPRNLSITASEPECLECGVARLGTSGQRLAWSFTLQARPDTEERIVLEFEVSGVVSGAATVQAFLHLVDTADSVYLCVEPAGEPGTWMVEPCG